MFYILENSIESGAHGTISKCRDGKGNQIAVKTIPKKFLVEAVIMLSLEHPNINSAISVFKVGDNLLIFQKLFIADVHEYMKERRISQETCERWCISLIRAIQFLHSSKIIHSDIKAKNLLVDANERIKLTDFAFSVIVKEPRRFHHRVCTFTHSPIEALVGDEGWSFPLDIWSLGCTMYEIQYNSLLFPFQGNSPVNWKDRAAIEEIHARHVAALYDWGNLNGGTYPKEDFSRYPVKPKFNPRFTNINNAIQSCLIMKQEDRPSIEKFVRIISVNNSARIGYNNRRKLRDDDLGLFSYDLILKHGEDRIRRVYQKIKDMLFFDNPESLNSDDQKIEEELLEDVGYSVLRWPDFE